MKSPDFRRYAFALCALLLLTASTAGVSLLRLRHGALAAALLFALAKASIVLLVFMHARRERVARAVLALALALYAALFGLSALDWAPRDAGLESRRAPVSTALHDRGLE